MSCQKHIKFKNIIYCPKYASPAPIAAARNQYTPHQTDYNDLIDDRHHTTVSSLQTPDPFLGVIYTHPRNLIRRRHTMTFPILLHDDPVIVKFSKKNSEKVLIEKRNVPSKWRDRRWWVYHQLFLYSHSIDLHGGD